MLETVQMNISTLNGYIVEMLTKKGLCIERLAVASCTAYTTKIKANVTPGVLI